jgi:hypothetical protein
MKTLTRSLCALAVGACLLLAAIGGASGRRVNVFDPPLSGDLAEALRTDAPRLFYLPYVEGRGWFAPDSNGFRLAAPGTELYGDGAFGEDVGLRYWADPAVAELRGTGNSTVLTIATHHVYVHDLVISNNRGPVQGGGDGIRYDEQATIWQIQLERVAVLYPGRYALLFRPQPYPDGTTNFVVAPVLRDVSAFGFGGEAGIRVEDATAMDWSNVVSTRGAGKGFIFRRLQSSHLNRLTAETVTGGILIEDSDDVTLTAPHLEDWAGSGPKPAAGIILRNCRGCVIGGGFFGEWGRPGAVSIRLEGCTGCTVLSNSHYGVATAVYGDAACRGNVIHAQAGARIEIDRRRNRVLE